ncbi:MAG: hypothetical protein ACAH95_00105 [Fimbriimonas sp.]
MKTPPKVDADDLAIDGIKVLQIRARTNFHTVSAYEFEYFKQEAEVQQRLSPCTIYLIVQRPLTYFTNVRVSEGLMRFDIVDTAGRPPLRCTFSPEENGFSKGSNFVDIDIQFYTDSPGKDQPFDHVAGFRLLGADGRFLYWLGPQKFLYEYASGAIKAKVKGDIFNYLDFEVHYIGKAFSQSVWARLTGHHKLQKILTMEETRSPAARKLAYEVSLIMLDVIGVDEMPVLGPWGFVDLAAGETPIVQRVRTEQDAIDFFKPGIDPGAAQLTNEVEAMLIKLFRPKYNEVLFEKYPNIGNGTRSLGYTKAELVIERLLATLKTEFHTERVIGSVVPHYAYSENCDGVRFGWTLGGARKLVGL